MILLNPLWQRRVMMILAVGGSLVFAAYGYYLYHTLSKRGSSLAEYKTLRHLLDAQALIQNNYISTKRLDADLLLERAIKGMANVDPYSHFENAEQAQLIYQRRSHDVCGVGMEIAENKDDELEVIDVIPYSPAAYANICEGDILLGIDDKMVEGSGIRQCKSKILGPKGSSIKLIIRDTQGKRRNIQLQRQSTINDDISPAFYLHNEIAMIRIGRLGKDAYKNFRRVLDEVERNNAKGIILDLRGAPGGDFDEAVKICNIFIEAGKPIVKLQTATAKGDGEWVMSEIGFKNLKLPMMVLIDSLTASAAEIIAGALKDHGRALIIGQPSFGKGIAQSEFRFSDGATLWLTNARYFTPRGYSIDLRGVEPDFYVKLTAEQQALARRSRRAYTDRENKKLLEDDVVLQTALERFSLFNKHKQNAPSDILTSNKRTLE